MKVDSPVDDVTDCAESSKHHEGDIHTEVFELVSVTKSGEDLIDSLCELDAVIARNGIDDRRVPECWAGGMEGSDEVNDTNEENTLDRAGESRQVECTSVELFPPSLVSI